MHFFYYTVADFCSSFPMQMSNIWQSMIYGDLKYSADFCEELFDLWWCKFSSLSLSSFALESSRYVHEPSGSFIDEASCHTNMDTHTHTHTHKHTHRHTNIYAIVAEKSHTQRTKPIHLKITIIQPPIQAEQWANIYLNQKHIKCRCTGSLEEKWKHCRVQSNHIYNNNSLCKWNCIQHIGKSHQRPSSSCKSFSVGARNGIFTFNHILLHKHKPNHVLV